MSALSAAATMFAAATPTAMYCNSDTWSDYFSLKFSAEKRQACQLLVLLKQCNKTSDGLSHVRTSAEKKVMS